MSKARDNTPPVLVRISGVHMGVATTTSGRKKAMADFALRLQGTINEMVAEGRIVSSEMIEGGALVIGKVPVDEAPPQALAALLRRQQTTEPPASSEAPLEINEFTHRMVHQFLTMARQLPPHGQQRQQHVGRMFEVLVRGVPATILQTAADDCDKILACRKRAQEKEGVPPGIQPGQMPDDLLLAEMRDMLKQRARVSFH
jgi:hypothetical protein